jgi:hypothetical protein
VVGPHFEMLCREYARSRGREIFGRPTGRVGPGTVADPAGKGHIEIDVAVLAPEQPGEKRRILSLGEAKWGKVMGLRQLDRLRRARSLLDVKGYDTSGTVLACYGAAGFDQDLRKVAQDGAALLVDLDRLYAP